VGGGVSAIVNSADKRGGAVGGEVSAAPREFHNIPEHSSTLQNKATFVNRESHGFTNTLFFNRFFQLTLFFVNYIKLFWNLHIR